MINDGACFTCGISEDDALERDGQMNGCWRCGRNYCKEHDDDWYRCGCSRLRKWWSLTRLRGWWPQCPALGASHWVGDDLLMAPACRRNRWHVGPHRWTMETAA